MDRARHPLPRSQPCPVQPPPASNADFVMNNDLISFTAVAVAAATAAHETFSSLGPVVAELRPEAFGCTRRVADED